MYNLLCQSNYSSLTMLCFFECEKNTQLKANFNFEVKQFKSVQLATFFFL